LILQKTNGIGETEAVGGGENRLEKVRKPHCSSRGSCLRMSYEKEMFTKDNSSIRGGERGGMAGARQPEQCPL